MFNSSFQWMWLVVVALPACWLLRTRWRSVVVVAVVPLLIVVGWYVKNAVMFQSYSTSSWLGMNVAKVTTSSAAPSELHRLIHNGVLTPLAAHQPFEPLRNYDGLFKPHAGTGVPVLDRPTKMDGAPNFNNVNYITISSDFLHNDLAYIHAHTFGVREVAGIIGSPLLLPR